MTNRDNTQQSTVKNAIVILLLLCSSVGHSESTSSGKKRSLTALAGFPHIVNGAFDYRLGSVLSLGLTGGIFSFNRNWSTGDRFKIVQNNIEARMRIFLGSSNFFIGVAGGYQYVSGDCVRSVTTSGISVDVLAHAETKNYYAIPHVGWFKVAANGFTIGVEAGLYMPINPRVSTDLSSTNPLLAVITSSSGYQGLQSDTNNFADEISNRRLPFLTALRLGWSF